MIRYAVVAFPRLGARDARWLESIRGRHDPQASVIRAHVTLMFPVRAAEESVIAAASRCVAGRGPFQLRLGEAVPFRDSVAERSYVFLLPSRGQEQITALHDALSRRMPLQGRGARVPYRPHVTVGQMARHEDSVRLATDLNRPGIDIRGRIGSIDVIAVGADRVSVIRTLRLRGGSPGPKRQGHGPAKETG